MGQNLLSIVASLSHSRTSHSVGLLRTSDQLIAEAATYTTHNKHKRRIYALSRIRARDPSHQAATVLGSVNRLTPNDPYMGRTAPLASKRCILYIYSTNISTEYFKHALYSPFFFSLQNAVCFIMLICLVPVLFTFYIQNVLKLKK